MSDLPIVVTDLRFVVTDLRFVVSDLPVVVSDHPIVVGGLPIISRGIPIVVRGLPAGVIGVIETIRATGALEKIILPAHTEAAPLQEMSTPELSLVCVPARRMAVATLASDAAVANVISAASRPEITSRWSMGIIPMKVATKRRNK